MITKEGIITQISESDSMVWIQTTRSKSCDSCESRDSCGEYSGTESISVKVENSLNASSGDRVVIGFRTAQLLKISFLLYIFPIILMIAGAIAGNSIGAVLGYDKSITSIIMAIIFFTVSFLIIRFVNDAIADKKEYQPFMMRLVQSSNSLTSSQCPKS